MLPPPHESSDNQADHPMGVGVNPALTTVAASPPLRSRPRGKSTRWRRIRLAEAQNWRCAYCAGAMAYEGAGPDCATIDHLVPKLFGGTLRYDNCISACRACNEVRGAELSCWQFQQLRWWSVSHGIWTPCTKPSNDVRRRYQQMRQKTAAGRLAHDHKGGLVVRPTLHL
jgi:hypothetical protein